METATETNSRLDRNVFGFWMLGLVNNFSWCVFASAAEDLLEGYAGVILLCMIIPGLLTKASSTFWFHLVPYNVRVGVVAIAVSSSMVAISVTNSLTTKLICLLLYSLLGAMGEMTFLSLTTYYPESVLGAWSSGTGLAGIAAAGVYYFMRQIVRLSASGTLVILSVVPLMLIVLYRFVLDQRHAHQTYSSVAEDVEDIPALKPADESTKDVAAERVLRRRLVFSFILPLGVVYFAEYTINSGTLGTFHESSFRYSRSSTTKKDTTHRLYTWLQLSKLSCCVFFMYVCLSFFCLLTSRLELR